LMPRQVKAPSSIQEVKSRTISSAIFRI